MLLFYILGLILTFIHLSILEGPPTNPTGTNRVLSISISWPFYALGLLWVYRSELAVIISEFLGEGLKEVDDTLSVLDEWALPMDGRD